MGKYKYILSEIKTNCHNSHKFYISLGNCQTQSRYHAHKEDSKEL